MASEEDPKPELARLKVLREANEVRGETDSQTFWNVPYTEPGAAAFSSRFLRLHAHRTQAPVHGTVVLIHGGYWKNKFGLDDEYGNAGIITLAPFFSSKGYLPVELEFRRRDHEGGGWPGTNHDMLDALLCLGKLKRSGGAVPAGMEPAPRDMEVWANTCSAIDLDRLIVLGHSAGGQLALWTAHQLVTQAGWMLPRSCICVAVAPCADLHHGHELKVSDDGDAVERYMKGTPEEIPEAYALACPGRLLPVNFPLLITYGDADDAVPPELMDAYTAKAVASNPALVSSLVVPGVDHFTMTNAATATWQEIVVPKLAEIVGVHWGAVARAALLSE